MNSISIGLSEFNSLKSYKSNKYFNLSSKLIELLNIIKPDKNSKASIKLLLSVSNYLKTSRGFFISLNISLNSSGFIAKLSQRLLKEP